MFILTHTYIHTYTLLYPVQTDPMEGFEEVTKGKVPKSRSITAQQTMKSFKKTLSIKK